MSEKLLDPDMPAQELRLHMGELTAQEERTARAAIRWANSSRSLSAAVEVVREAVALSPELRHAVAAAACPKFHATGMMSAAFLAALDALTSTESEDA